MADVVGLDTLESVVTSVQELDDNIERLRKLGGVEGLLSRVMRVPAADLESHVKYGLAAADVPSKRESFGANTLPVKILKTWVELFVDVFKDDQTVLILMGEKLVSVCVANGVATTVRVAAALFPDDDITGAPRCHSALLFFVAEQGRPP